MAVVNIQRVKTQTGVRGAPTRFSFGIDLGYERYETDLATSESRHAHGRGYRRAQTELQLVILSKIQNHFAKDRGIPRDDWL